MSLTTPPRGKKRAYCCKKCGDIAIGEPYPQNSICNNCRLPGLQWLAWDSPEEDAAAERFLLRHQDAYGGYKRFAREVFPSTSR